MNYAVIMAGGVGTRFWPMSRQETPKQFLKLFSDQTLLQQTVNRLNGFIQPENVMVITNNDYKKIVYEQLSEVNESYIIGEPVAKNTAPCIASAAAILLEDDPDAVMIVMPADHEIENINELLCVFESAVETAKCEDTLVTIGIKPNRPETGYGYIRREREQALSIGDNPVYKVRNFTEKPDVEIAEQFLKSGDYLWNSGIFVWKAATIAKAFKNYLPDVYANMEKLMNSDRTREDINEFYHACPSVSIDYGVMEKAESVHVIPADFGWNDIGSWQAVHELSRKDKNKNTATSKETIFLDSSNNYVHSKSGKLITLVGVDNIAVVETDDAIMVLNLGKAQEVKSLVEILKNTPELKKYL